MIRKIKKTDQNIINLDGPDGNAFNLIGVLTGSFKKSGLDLKPVVDEMMSGLPPFAKVFNWHCGVTYTLLTSDQALIDVIQKEEKDDLRKQILEIWEK